MANEWLRLWHDMPNDPKWRTIARISKQPISLVKAVFLHLLVDASRNVTRGHIDVTHEDLASALDCDESQIECVLDAMQGRVLCGNQLTGWDRRQPKREDQGSDFTGAKSAAERKRAQREREKQALEQQCHDVSRNVTTDKDKDKDTDITPQPPTGGAEARFDVFWSAYPKKSGKDAGRKAFAKRKPNDALLTAMLAAIAVQKNSEQWTRDGGRYIPNPATWLNEGRWQDEVTPAASSDSEGDSPQWALDAGFPNRYEAGNAMCWQHNAHQFRDGKRIDGVAA